MYGLPHTGILAHKALVKYMNKNGYYPIEYTNRLWKWKYNNVIFTLVVDNFSVKVNSDQEASHVINALQEKYTIDVDYTGLLYVGVTLK